MINFHDGIDVFSLLPIDTRTANANGVGVDIKDYIGKLKIILDSTAGTGTSPTLDVKIQESDDNITFTDISDAIFSQVTTIAKLDAIGLTVAERKRFIRAVATIEGTSPSFIFSVNAIGIKQIKA